MRQSFLRCVVVRAQLVSMSNPEDALKQSFESLLVALPGRVLGPLEDWAALLAWSNGEF
jgi:hypothetical protein